MGRLKILRIISLGALVLTLTGCFKKGEPSGPSPIEGKKVVLEADDGDNHKAVFIDDDGLYYSYDFHTTAKENIRVRSELKEALNIEADMDVKADDNTDDITPYAISDDIYMIAPNTYQCVKGEQEKYLGYLYNKGYTMQKVYKSADYNDYFLKRGMKRLRVIFSKDYKIKIFQDSTENKDSSDTYINERIR